MPFDPSRYPANWPEMSRRARLAAGNRCQQCGVANGATRARDRHGTWWDEDAIHGMNHDVGYALFAGEFPKMTRIVLTCHHPDRDTANPAARLEVLCQKCHLAADRDLHTAKARATRRRRRLEATGQRELELTP